MFRALTSQTVYEPSPPGGVPPSSHPASSSRLSALPTANKTKSESFNPYSAGIDFSHHNLTSVDVRLVDPRTVRVKLVIMAVDPYHRYSNKSERAE